MNSIGEFVLIIGDIHIPQRAASLPEPFRDLLMPGKMQHVICPGNVGSREVSTPHPRHPLNAFTEPLALAFVVY